MQNRYIYVKLVSALIALIFVFAVIGCPGPQNAGADRTGDNVAAGDQQAGQETPGDAEEETPQVNEQAERQFRELVGDSEELTQEKVETLSGFGVFLFPGAQLNAADSMHQSLVDGTELYRLVMGTETELATVADWYRANLEAGFEESNIEMAPGAKIIGFTVSAPDNSWRKSITVQGIEGEGKSQISAELIKQGAGRETTTEPEAGTTE